MVPGAVEIAEEEEIVILQRLALLCLAKVRETMPWNNDPTRKLDKREIDEIELQALYVPQQEEERAQNPSLPRPHGSDGVHRVDFPVNVAHRAPCNHGIGMWSHMQLPTRTSLEGAGSSQRYRIVPEETQFCTAKTTGMRFLYPPS